MVERRDTRPPDVASDATPQAVCQAWYQAGIVVVGTPPDHVVTAAIYELR